MRMVLAIAGLMAALSFGSGAALAFQELPHRRRPIFRKASKPRPMRSLSSSAHRMAHHPRPAPLKPTKTEG